MTLLYYKIIAIFIIFIMTWIAAFQPFWKIFKTAKLYDFVTGEALACGVFLGAGLIHLLADANHEFLSFHIHYPWAFAITGLVFLIMLWLEHVGRELSESHTYEFFLILLAVTLLALHSFFEGAALGLSNNLPFTTVIFIAIVAHKWAAAFALAVQLSKVKMRFINRIWIFGFFSIMTPLGIVLGNFLLNPLNRYVLLAPIVTSIAAGSFIYLGTLHGLQRAILIEKCCDLRNYSFVILGFLLMAFAAIWI